MVSRISRHFGNDANAEDCVQEALVRSWQRAARGKAIDSLAAWVATVAANAARDQSRRRSAEQRALARLAHDQPGLLAGVVPASGDCFLSDVAERVQALPRRQRDVVMLHYYEELSVEETAALLGVGEGTVKRSLFRARQALQRTLGHMYGTASPSGRPGQAAPSHAQRRTEMKGWFMAGSHPQQYEHGIAEKEHLGGKRVVYLRAKPQEPAGFGTLMQMIAANEYRGKRVRFVGSAKVVGVDGWAGLWMRVDGPEQGRSLAFDNMQRRPIKGTTDWERYEVVLDVAEAGQAATFGVLLAGGGGEIRVADFSFEVVPSDVPTTEPVYPKQPENLDLAQD